ncbi:MAG: ankyrin repeat domain-containing protein [Bacillota bacterium]
MNKTSIPDKLIDAIRNDDPSKLNIQDFKYRDARNQSLLFYAVRQNALRVLKAFTNNLSLNESNTYGDTPLHVAASIGNSEVVGLLLDAGADAKLKNKKGVTPLMAASRKGSLDTVHRFLNDPPSLSKTDVFGNTCLFYAVESNNPQVFETLVKAGVNPHHLNTQRETLHHAAAKHASFEMVEILENHKVPLYILSDYKETPLHHAAKKGKADHVAYYLKRGLLPSRADGFMKTPKDYGNDYGDIEMLFTRFESDLEKATAMQTHPLCKSLRHADFEKAFVLIKEGKSLDEKDIFGNRPVFYAMIHNQIEIYTALMDHQVQMDDIDYHHHDVSYYLNLLKLDW